MDMSLKIRPNLFSIDRRMSSNVFCLKKGLNKLLHHIEIDRSFLISLKSSGGRYFPKLMLLKFEASIKNPVEILLNVIIEIHTFQFKYFNNNLNFYIHFHSYQTFKNTNFNF